MIKNTNPREAHELLQAGGHVYLDVRTSAEFAAGHVPDAVNIPVMESEPATGGMFPNKDFMRVVEANLDKTARILVGCQAGGRSLMASQMMETAGYTKVYNVAGGFGGKTDASGNVVEEGWSTLGLPVDEGGVDCYAALKREAEAS